MLLARSLQHGDDTLPTYSITQNTLLLGLEFGLYFYFLLYSSLHRLSLCSFLSYLQA